MSNQDDLFQRIVDESMRNAGGSSVAPTTGVPEEPRMPVNALGTLQAQGHGLAVTMPGAGGHVLTVALAAGTGAALGAASSATWRGAGIGAAANLGLVGTVNAAFGRGMVGTGGRVAYGILGALGVGLATWLMVQRNRRR